MIHILFAVILVSGAPARVDHVSLRFQTEELCHAARLQILNDMHELAKADRNAKISMVASCLPAVDAPGVSTGVSGR